MKDKATTVALTAVIGFITLAIIIGFVWTGLPGAKQ